MSCQWRDCGNPAERERLGKIKDTFNRNLTLFGTICDTHKPELASEAQISYWICGSLAFLEAAEAETPGEFSE